MNRPLKQILSTALILLLCLGMVACANSNAAAAPAGTAALALAHRSSRRPAQAEATQAPTAEPAAECADEPEYLKYAAIRDELKEKFATTREAYEQVKRMYGLSPSTDPKGIFLVDWDTADYSYNYRLSGIVRELLTEQYYAMESDTLGFLRSAMYDPAEAIVEAPGVLRAEQNCWLNVLREEGDYTPMYFISLESEDPASGCWMCLYRDLPENVLHAALVGEEEIAALEEAALVQKLAENGVTLSEGELIIDGVDYAALRNHLAKAYMTDSALWAELYSTLDAVTANPFGKTSNGAFFVDWDNPNARFTGWYLDKATKVWKDISKKSKNNGGHPTAEMLKTFAFDPDKVEILADSILRSTSNKWLKSKEYMIWISLQSTDPHTGIWVGFYGPIPPAAQE